MKVSEGWETDYSRKVKPSNYRVVILALLFPPSFNSFLTLVHRVCICTYMRTTKPTSNETRSSLGVLMGAKYILSRIETQRLKQSHTN